jgi:Na+-translocating ferredoxin:NAD+ oxidoreductase RnfC subunit
MMGRMAKADDIISEKTNFIGYGYEINYSMNVKCKNCRACARKCPMKIKVHKVIQSLEKNDFKKGKEFQPERCIQCGTCTYYCNAGKNTMELISQYL